MKRTTVGLDPELQCRAGDVDAISPTLHCQLVLQNDWWHPGKSDEVGDDSLEPAIGNARNPFGVFEHGSKGGYAARIP